MIIPTPKFGKKAASYDHRDLMLAKYLDLTKLPPIPTHFGDDTLIQDWGMLGNDNYGNCVWAGAAHETIYWTKLGDPATAEFNDAVVLSDYAAVTGFKASDPNTDQGTDMHDAMNYRRNVGILDAAGKRHKILAYVWIEPGNVQELLAGMFIFKAAGLGIQFPNSAMTQFNSGRPWSIQGGARIEGGHYVPAFFKPGRYPKCVTWGRVQSFTSSFYSRYNDETAIMISEDFLVGGKSPDGFDMPTLLTDLRNL